MWAVGIVVCPSVIPSVQALSLSLRSRRPHQVLPVCILPRLHVEGRVCRQCGGMSFRLFIYPVGPLLLFIRSGPFCYLSCRGPFRLGCTQTCLLHIHYFFLASIFLLYGLFFFDFSASIFFVVRPICFVYSAAFVTENF